METKVPRLWRTHQLSRLVIAIMCAILLVCEPSLFAQQAQPVPQPQQPAPITQQPTQQPQQPAENVKIPADQLDSLVAPIALYPDPLLSQTLVASTYPLEIIQLQQWLEKNPGLKDQALVDAVSKQPWDPSIKAMAALPDLVKRLANNIQWTTDLGNAFLAQESDVMNAVQRMRAKAENNGTLKSDEHQKVETRVENNKDVIVVEQANPDVVYVPEYNPTAVYGAAAYPYPSIYYPPYYGTGAAIATGAIAFGTGIALGAMWGGGWGWGAGWGFGDVDVNMNNNFNRNSNFNRNNINRTGRNTWQHNPAHRGGTPYANRATANRFGSNARGDSLASRRQGAQQQINRQKPGGARGGAGGARAGAGGARAGAGGARAGAGGARAGAGSFGGAGSRAGARSSFGGGDRIGNRSIGGGSGRSGFGGGGYSRGNALSSRSRGSSSLRSSRGGGRSFGGGGRSRGGGGRSRGGGGRGGGGRGGGRR
jgi:hypothetical protein